MLRNRQAFRRILRHGWKYGHQYDPRFRRLRDLSLSDLDKLDEGHSLAKDLVASVQHSGGAVLDGMVMEEHGRGLILDGDAGPATLGLIDVPRCGAPDWGPGSGAHVMEDGSLVDEMGEMLMSAEELNIAPKSMGTGSWPHSCYPEFPQVHVYTVGMNLAAAQRAWLDNLDEIFSVMTRCDLEIGRWRIFVNRSLNPMQAWTPRGWVLLTSILANPVINREVTFRAIGGSTIGINQVPSRFSCGMRITGSLDTGYSPNPEDHPQRIRRIGRLDNHEDAHGCGLGHSSGIMLPYITDGPVRWIGDHNESTMKRFFGGIQIDPTGFPGWSFGSWL